MRLLASLFCLIQVTLLNAQVSSRNGFHFAPYDTLRVFIIFAEVVNDPAWTSGTPYWEAGQLPEESFIKTLLDDNVEQPEQISGRLTQYFYKASFGQYFFLGDYLPKLIQTDYDSLLTQSDIQKIVIDSLNALPGEDIVTASGRKLLSADFDRLTIDRTVGNPTFQTPDDQIDMIFFIYRINSKLGKTTGGNIRSGSIPRLIKSRMGSNSVGQIIAPDLNITGLIRHEFAHLLLGGNNFHSGEANSGTGNFLSNIGGYSLLGGGATSNRFLNAFDRWRLGWKECGKQHYISAISEDGTEINGDLVYQAPFENGALHYDFVLRDFETTGDAIRIALPYLQTQGQNANNQWIWLENHQFIEGSIEADGFAHQKGLYVNCQIGNGDTTDFSSSRTNSIVPMQPLGNYDFVYIRDNEYSDSSHYIAMADDSRANPLTGHHILMRPAINYVDPNWHQQRVNKQTITEPHFDEIFSNEYINISKVFHNQISLPATDFAYFTTMYGSRHDGFTEGRVINISSNPAPVPLVTHITASRSNTWYPAKEVSATDNRLIFLNGIRIEFLRQLSSGDIVVRIKWNDYDLTQDVRWCGDIVLNETIQITSGQTLTLDQGLTPVLPKPHYSFTGEKVYAPPTTLSCNAGSQYIQQPFSTLLLKNGSKLIAKEESSIRTEMSKIIIGPGCCVELSGNTKLSGKSSIVVEAGGVLKLSKDTFFLVSGSSIRVANGASILISDSARLQIDSSELNLESGAIICLSSASVALTNQSRIHVGSSSQSCLSSTASIQLNDSCSKLELCYGYVLTCPTDYPQITQGEGVVFQPVFVQNNPDLNNTPPIGSSLLVGRCVTSGPCGDVIIQAGKHVVMKAASEIIFHEGFEVKTGGSLDTQTDLWPCD